MIDVINLEFDYQDKPLLNGVNLHLKAGDLLHLRGANGAGKTTLLRLIAGLNQPMRGQIQFMGRSIYDDLAAYQDNICFIGHRAGINPLLTIKENCLFDSHYQDQDIQALAAHFHLQDYLDYPCGVLSAGQTRQVALLRLWMTSRSLWLLDEPLVALDETAVNTLLVRIREHRDTGGAVLITSHQPLPIPSSEYQEYCL